MHVTVGELIGNFVLITGSFILLLVLIKKFAWSNITGIFEERAEKIASDIDRAEEARQKAEVLAQKREDELAGSREDDWVVSRKEAKTIIENAKETAEQSKANILADAKLEAGHLKEKANQEIAQNKVEALQSVKGEVADLTISLAGKIISQNLDSHAHKALIDQYIDQLGEA
ncbi:F0F1 ATP synthase subunit B [Streptococcus pneumoniae]|uniref:F0F1 ATP synthase subunit B n=3 Tax=Streptococcus pneumoniae TaxID=1313 RepID=UPI0005DF1126|nr:F0F1 ATP synthase subunit B [Streptococcus pneumoniae]CIQ83724.1 proton-translocating ATPase%2C F0 sector%2C subunit b [Streptococcus pneumoniae]